MELWEQGSYDLIVMDIQMPVMNGIEAAQVIREREQVRGGHIPILALTAHAFQDDVNACQAAGMDSCLVKPVDLNEFIKAIHELLGKRESLRQ